MDIETFNKAENIVEVRNKNIQGNLSKEDEGEIRVDFDQLLSSAGEFGLYQFFLFLATFPFHTFAVFMYFTQMFMTEVSPDHWCWIPELANLSIIERRNLAIPKDGAGQFGYSQCSSYATNWSEVLATGSKPNETWKTLPCQDGWEFNQTEIPYPTISSELGWVCDKRSYQANAQAIFFLGSIFGGFTLGTIADNYGRIPAIVTSNMIACTAGIVSTFARNFAVFAICRFFVGVAFNGCFSIVYLLILEYISPRYRTLITNLSSASFYSVTQIILPWIVLTCGHWKIISLVTSVPMVLGILTPFILPESPRWLLSKERVDDCIEKVIVIGGINKKVIPPTLIEQFKKFASKEAEQEFRSTLDILKIPLIRNNFILICLEFMCCAIVYDGLVRSTGQLEFDFFLSFSITASTELPSIILLALILDWMGRRWMVIVCMAFSCIFSILATLIGSGLSAMICISIARFAINMSYNATLQWAAELLPTSVRGSGIVSVYICGSFATIISPYIIYLNTYVHWLPLVIIGCVSGTGTVLAFFIPETANKNMPQLFEDSENLAKSQKIWHLPCIRRTKTTRISIKNNDNGQVNYSFQM